MVNGSRKIKWFLIAGAVVFIMAVYLNRAYARIYNTIGSANLKPVSLIGSYLVANNMSSTNKITYVALGDSLTAGVGTDVPEESLPYLLAQKMAGEYRQINLKNYSVPGFKSSDLISELLPGAIKENPSIITLLVGVNDIHNQVTEARFRRNYADILDRLTQETRANIYIISIPFIGADSMMIPPYDMYFQKRTEKFNQIIKKLAEERSLKYIDLYSPSVDLFKKAGDHYSPDLFHPSARGYKIWADIIYDSINK